MNIIEYYTKLSASGVLSKSENIYAEQYDRVSFDIVGDSWWIRICDGGLDVPKMFADLVLVDDKLQLRTDGVDLYKLKWRKPTEEDVGKMCWFLVGFVGKQKAIMLSTLTLVADNNEDGYPPIEIVYEFETHINPDVTMRCLLADHGRIAPKPEDFEQVYEDKKWYEDFEQIYEDQKWHLDLLQE